MGLRSKQDFQHKNRPVGTSLSPGTESLDGQLRNRGVFGETGSCSSYFTLKIYECKGCCCCNKMTGLNDLMRFYTKHNLDTHDNKCRPWFTSVDTGFRVLMGQLREDLSAKKAVTRRQNAKRNPSSSNAIALAHGRGKRAPFAFAFIRAPRPHPSAGLSSHSRVPHCMSTHSSMNSGPSSSRSGGGMTFSSTSISISTSLSSRAVFSPSRVLYLM